MNISKLVLRKYASSNVIKSVDTSIKLAVAGSSPSYRHAVINFLFSETVHLPDIGWILPHVLPERFSIQELDWNEALDSVHDFDAVIGAVHPLDDAVNASSIARLFEKGVMPYALVLGISSISTVSLLKSMGAGHLRLIRWLPRMKSIDPGGHSVEITEAQHARLIQQLAQHLEKLDKGMSFVRYMNDPLLKEQYLSGRIHEGAMAAASLFLFELYSFPTMKALISMGREVEIVEEVTPPTMTQLIDGLVHSICYVHTGRKASESTLQKVHSFMKWGLMPLYMMSGLSGGVMGVLVYMLVYGTGRALDMFLTRVAGSSSVNGSGDEPDYTPEEDNRHS